MKIENKFQMFPEELIDEDFIQKNVHSIPKCHFIAIVYSVNGSFLKFVGGMN